MARRIGGATAHAYAVTAAPWRGGSAVAAAHQRTPRRSGSAQRGDGGLAWRRGRCGASVRRRDGVGPTPAAAGGSRVGVIPNPSPSRALGLRPLGRPGRPNGPAVLLARLGCLDSKRRWAENEIVSAHRPINVLFPKFYFQQKFTFESLDFEQFIFCE